MTDDAKTAASLLREARLHAGLSQQNLALVAGVSQSVISAYESGRRQPSLPVLMRLIRATGGELEFRVYEPRSAALTGPLGRRVRQRRAQLMSVAYRHHASNLRIFGSTARGEDTLESDIDIIADVPPDMGLLGLARFQRDLEDVLEAPVDIVPAGTLKPRIEKGARHDEVAL